MQTDIAKIGEKTTEEMVREMYQIFMQVKMLLDEIHDDPQTFLKRFVGDNPMLAAFLG